MLLVARVILTLLFAAAALFCLFGIAATFEPLPPATQWLWRFIYTFTLFLGAGLTWKMWRKPG